MDFRGTEAGRDKPMCGMKEQEDEEGGVKPPLRAGKAQIGKLGEAEGIADAEEFVGFGGGDASVGGEAVEVVEAGAGGPGRESGFAELGEAFLEAVEGFAGEGIAGRDGATGAGIAALEIDFTDFESDDAAFVFAEELVFPPSRDSIYFERRTEALAGFVERDAGETVGGLREPVADGL